jgi:hypothetical protein
MLPQALAAQKALRDSLGMPDEQFPLPAFIGMVSDEIEQARAAGRDDAAIAALLSQAGGTQVSAADIARFYAPPEQRQRG